MTIINRIETKKPVMLQRPEISSSELDEIFELLGGSLSGETREEFRDSLEVWCFVANFKSRKKSNNGTVGIVTRESYKEVSDLLLDYSRIASMSDVLLNAPSGSRANFVRNILSFNRVSESEIREHSKRSRAIARLISRQIGEREISRRGRLLDKNFDVRSKSISMLCFICDKHDLHPTLSQLGGEARGTLPMLIAKLKQQGHLTTDIFDNMDYSAFQRARNFKLKRSSIFLPKKSKRR